MNERLFVYGTLLDPDIQLAVVGRRLDGAPDSLTGCRLTTLKHGPDAYPNIVCDTAACVVGRVLDVTLEELDRMDEYEGDLYIRERVALESGGYAWVYVGVTSP
ncbi:MAG: gamma-glutamylcyclotransferase family protein [Candidatus Hydrogenedentes bacterium]|nr:gamma-glutamylcyclotransferase family protein [Candidatus Hydrogenedentota bacterium]